MLYIENYQQVLEALESPSREFRNRITFGYWSSDRTFVAEKTIESGIKSLKIKQPFNSSESNILMGCVCSASCSVEFFNPDKSYIYADKVLFIECCIKVEDSYIPIPLGYYNTGKPESDDDWFTVKIEAYDDINALDGTWETALIFPTELKNVIEEITGNLPIEYEEKLLNSSLLSRLITSDEAEILANYTKRNVLGYLLGVCGSNARMTTAGNVRIGFFETPTTKVNITADIQWQNGFKKLQDTAFTVNSISSGEGETVYTAGTGKGISFVNPIITQDDVDKIYSLRIPFDSYTPSECEWRGNPCVEAGDIVTVTDRNGNEYIVLIASQEIDLIGGLSSNISCPNSDEEISFQTGEVTPSQLKKQYTTLQALQSKLSAEMLTALGVYSTEVTSSAGATVYYFHNMPTLWQSTYVYTFNEKGMAWANREASETETADETVIASIVWQYGLTSDGAGILETLITNNVITNVVQAGKVLVENESTDTYIFCRESVSGEDGKYQYCEATMTRQSTVQITSSGSIKQSVSYTAVGDIPDEISSLFNDGELSTSENLLGGGVGVYISLCDTGDYWFFVKPTNWDSLDGSLFAWLKPLLAATYRLQSSTTFSAMSVANSSDVMVQKGIALINGKLTFNSISTNETANTVETEQGTVDIENGKFVFSLPVELYRGVLTESDDLNNLKDEGVYYYATASIPKNCPYENAGVVEVIKADSTTTRIIQRVTRYGVSGNTTFRTLFNGNWNDWVEISVKNETMLFQQVSSTGTNLNDYVIPGAYFFGSDYRPTNIPIGANGWLLVMANSTGSIVKQIWFRAGTANSNDYQIYLRTLVDGSWSNWHNWYANSEYEVGDSISVSINTAGYVTGSGTTVFFTVPLSKSVIGSPAVSAFDNSGFIFRNAGKYTHGSASGSYAKADSITAKLIDSQAVEIKAVFSDTTNVTNNAATGVAWSGTISFN